MKVTNTKQKLPDFCPACDEEGDIWVKAEKQSEQIFRGEKFEVNAEITKCKHCGFEILADGQAERLVHVTWDAYRKSRGLLTV